MTVQPAEILLSPSAMARVDAAAASCMESYGLMRRAGEAVAACALRLFPAALRFVVLCGPGNNGGDGYVAAAALVRAGASTTVHHLGDPSALKGDAARAYSAASLPSQPLSSYAPDPGDVIIDAVFGAGLARDVPQDMAELVARLTEARLPVLAVDLPSGVDGMTGLVRGAALQATATVTFMTRKPGHLLLPGRLLCGAIEVFDIGIPRRLVDAEAERLFVNGPSLWQNHQVAPAAGDHKYRRGHLTVFSGGATATGAARLSAVAALKAGAGLVTVASPAGALPANAAHLTAIMLQEINGKADLESYLKDPRRTTFVLGPGFGDFAAARTYALSLGAYGRAVVLDADGITAFRNDVKTLRTAFSDGGTRLVVTPHEGEFVRLFPEVSAMPAGKVEKARTAASELGGIVVYKGADTVIAAPDGRAAINETAPPQLATAGSGDVLAGIIAALMGQGLPAFEAASAGVYLHGEAAFHAGSGMTAEDLAASVRPLT
ncbi:bifunctional ADP-dependent NAD(P)H-hydrate dehydratase/NAD(P)H-hydrate epimerase [Rhizobium sp. PDO1-076]|uniref:bifunctional ADP-dependent NAD(P)H-hydrate dehydratase/NAD(P)H-hydrate epimerase n=1 Tax=Rhizobium sp. PDO1-076 TaxID=1125979 RepID=UPI000561B0C7|nr:bifunctional ADP-dependent NAD(P)H-hydrate dehydratase/NAD(P)H-hydrate epimerase [Rhizobium sp. PDO1-076]